MSAGPGFHRCFVGSMDIVMAYTAEIALFGDTAALGLESMGVRLAVPINACPWCLEPLTPVGVALDRIKRVEELK